MKRLIPLLLSLILTVSAVCVPVSAEDTTTTVAEVGFNADSIQDVSVTGLNLESYSGFASFKISSAKGLVMLSHIVNRTIQHDALPPNANHSSFLGRTLWLTADIDMSETVYYLYDETTGLYDFNVTAETPNVLSATASELFVPIGIISGYAFKGIFDGQGYTIKNLDVTYSTYTALFYKTYEATIQNVILDETCSFTATATSNATAASVVGCPGKTTKIVNCFSKAQLNGTILGGIVGEGGAATAEISNCTNAASITATSTAGGIVGKGVIQISDCRNMGNITANAYVGGIMGWSTGATVISNCVNNGVIMCANNGSSGGIVGRAQAISSITGCRNYGTLTSNQPEKTHTIGAIIATNGVNYVIPESNLDKTGETDQTLIDQMLTVKAQISVGTTIDSESTSLRLVSSIDSINYKEVYFVISLSDTDISLVDHKENITTVYSTIGETKESALIQRTAYAEFAPQSQFFSTFSITEIGNENFDMTVTAQVFAVDMEGNTICGKQTTFQVSDLIPAA